MSLITIQDRFHAFKDTWVFNRTLTDTVENHKLGVVTGTATFTPTAEHALTYHETGTFTTIVEKSFTIEQSYLYRYTHENKTITVYFPNGTLFHTLTFNKHCSATGSHLCHQDTYTAYYDFAPDKHAFSLHYIVQGPKKHYDALTLFKKQSI